VGYRPGNPGIPMLDLPLALSMGLSADKAVQKEAGSRAEQKAFDHGSFDDCAFARFSNMTNQKRKDVLPSALAVGDLAKVKRAEAKKEEKI
jgi:hypothetical protein